MLLSLLFSTWIMYVPGNKLAILSCQVVCVVVALFTTEPVILTIFMLYKELLAAVFKPGVMELF